MSTITIKTSKLAEPRPMHLNDCECGRRFALDLRTMALSDALFVSSHSAPGGAP